MRKNLYMHEIPEGYFKDDSRKEIHEEKVDRIARLIGGYIGNVVQGIGYENFVGIVQPDEFPKEVWSAVTSTRSGTNDSRIRLDPYLSFAYPLLQAENPTAIYWEVLAKSPEIALYATGDLVYAYHVENSICDTQERLSDVSWIKRY